MGGDVLDGYDACAAILVEQDPRAADAEVLACSSAGGGLRIAVVGNEELVTAEAGRRVALSSGGKVVGVFSQRDHLTELPELRTRRGAADRRHRRWQRRTHPPRGPGPGRQRLERSGRRGRQRRGPRRRREDPRRRPARRRRQRGAPDRGAGARVGPGRDPGDVPRPRDRRQAPQPAGGFREAGPRRHPRRGPHRGRAPRPRPRRRAPGRRRRRGRRRGRRDHRRAQRRRAGPRDWFNRGGRAVARGGGHHPGDPDRRG